MQEGLGRVVESVQSLLGLITNTERDESMSTTEPSRFYHQHSTLERQRSFVNGRFVSSNSGTTFQTQHPGTGHVICDVEVADPALVDAAVAAAEQAFLAWSQTPAAERGAILRRAALLLLSLIHI